MMADDDEMSLDDASQGSLAAGSLENSTTSLGSVLETRIQRRRQNQAAQEEEENDDEKQGSMSEGARRALRRRRLLEAKQAAKDMQNYGDVDASKLQAIVRIQAIVRGSLARATVSKMIAAMIIELQTSMAAIGSGGGVVTEEEDDDDDSSSNPPDAKSVASSAASLDEGALDDYLQQEYGGEPQPPTVVGVVDSKQETIGELQEQEPLLRDRPEYDRAPPARQSSGSGIFNRMSMYLNSPKKKTTPNKMIQIQRGSVQAVASKFAKPSVDETTTTGILPGERTTKVWKPPSKPAAAQPVKFAPMPSSSSSSSPRPPPLPASTGMSIAERIQQYKNQKQEISHKQRKKLEEEAQALKQKINLGERIEEYQQNKRRTEIPKSTTVVVVDSADTLGNRIQQYQKQALQDERPMMQDSPATQRRATTTWKPPLAAATSRESWTSGGSSHSQSLPVTSSRHSIASESPTTTTRGNITSWKQQQQQQQQRGSFVSNTPSSAGRIPDSPLAVWKKRESDASSAAAAAAQFFSRPLPLSSSHSASQLPTASNEDDDDDYMDIEEPGDGVVQEEEDNEELAHDYEEYSGAVQMQALVRGFLVRKQQQAMQPSMTFAERQRAFLNPSSNKAEEKSPRVVDAAAQQSAQAKLAARQQRMHRSATKIQALVRGYLVRSVDLDEVLYAVDILEYYKTLGPLPGENERFVDSELAHETRQALAARHMILFQAASKIQAVVRGMLIRKFDLRAMTRVVNYLRIHQQLNAMDDMEEDEYYFGGGEDEENEDPIPEPDVADLEKALNILQANQEARQASLSTTHATAGQVPESVLSSLPSPGTILVPQPVNVTELLSTWDWLKAKEQQQEQEILQYEDEVMHDGEFAVLPGQNDGEFGLSGGPFPGAQASAGDPLLSTGLAAAGIETGPLGADGAYISVPQPRASLGKGGVADRFLHSLAQSSVERDEGKDPMGGGRPGPLTGGPNSGGGSMSDRFLQSVGRASAGDTVSEPTISSVAVHRSGLRMEPESEASVGTDPASTRAPHATLRDSPFTASAGSLRPRDAGGIASGTREHSGSSIDVDSSSNIPSMRLRNSPFPAGSPLPGAELVDGAEEGELSSRVPTTKLRDSPFGSQSGDLASRPSPAGHDQDPTQAVSSAANSRSAAGRMEMDSSPMFPSTSAPSTTGSDPHNAVTSAGPSHAHKMQLRGTPFAEGSGSSWPNDAASGPMDGMVPTIRPSTAPRTGDLVAFYGWLQENGLTASILSDAARANLNGVTDRATTGSDALTPTAKDGSDSSNVGLGAAPPPPGGPTSEGEHVVIRAQPSAEGDELGSSRVQPSGGTDGKGVSLSEGGHGEASMIGGGRVMDKVDTSDSSPPIASEPVASTSEEKSDQSSGTSTFMDIFHRIETLASVEQGFDSWINDNQAMVNKLKEMVRTGKVNFDEIYDLWNWLEANDFDMSKFKRRAVELGLVDSSSVAAANSARERRMAEFSANKLGELGPSGESSLRATFKTNIQKIERNVEQRGFVPPTHRADYTPAGSRANLQYIDEDLSVAYKQQVAAGKIDSTKLFQKGTSIQSDSRDVGDVATPMIEYINEDLSDFYRPQGGSRKIVRNRNGDIIYLDEDLSNAYGGKLMSGPRRHDAETRNIGVRYLNEDLSAAGYRRKAEAAIAEGKSASEIQYLDEDLSDVYKQREAARQKAIAEGKSASEIQYLDEDLSDVYKRREAARQKAIAEGKSASEIQYLDEDLSDVYKRREAARQKAIAEGKSGNEIQYLDEDLSAVYKQREAARQKAIAEGRSASGIRYLNEDLSAAGYRRKAEAAIAEGKSASEIQYLDEDLSDVYKQREAARQKAIAEGKSASEIQYLDEDLSDVYKRREAARQKAIAEGKSASEIQYLDEDLSDVYKRREAARQKAIAEGKSGNEIQYLDEDLSEVYKQREAARQKAIAEGRSASGIRYLNEDLSAAGYRRKAEAAIAEGKSASEIQYLDEDPSDVYKQREAARQKAIAEGKSASEIQYLDEDLSDVYRQREAARQKAIAEGKSASELEYLDEDLSDVYKQREAARKSSIGIANNPFKQRDVARSAVKAAVKGAVDHGNENSQIEYLGDDLSGVYKKKPSLAAMVNYYGFSKQHASAVTVVEKQPANSSTGVNPKAVPIVSKPWLMKPSNNSMLNTLKWMDQRGVNLENPTGPFNQESDEPIEADESSEEEEQEEEETEVVAEPLKKQDLTKTMSWLMSHGFVKKTQTTPMKDSVPEQSMESLPEGDETENVAVEEETELLKGPPKSNDMFGALDWLHQHGFGANKSVAAAGGSAPEDEAPKKGSVPAGPTAEDDAKLYDSKILHSLSWLQSHGFLLDKPEGPKADGEHGIQAANQVQAAPSVDSMMDALDELDKEESDDEDVASPDQLLVRRSKKPYKKKSSVVEMENALNWLKSRGIAAPKKKKSTKKKKTKSKKSKNAGDAEEEPDVKTQSRRSSKSSLVDGGEHDASVASKTKRGVSSAEMSSALNFLVKKGIAVPKAAVSKTSHKPNKSSTKKRSDKDVSASDAEALLKELKSEDAAATSGPNAPGVQETELALKFLKLRETKQKAKPSKAPSVDGVARALSFLGKHSKPQLSKPTTSSPVPSPATPSAIKEPESPTKQKTDISEFMTKFHQRAQAKAAAAAGMGTGATARNDDQVIAELASESGRLETVPTPRADDPTMKSPTKKKIDISNFMSQFDKKAKAAAQASTTENDEPDTVSQSKPPADDGPTKRTKGRVAKEKRVVEKGPESDSESEAVTEDQNVDGSSSSDGHKSPTRAQPNTATTSPMKKKIDIGAFMSQFDKKAKAAATAAEGSKGLEGSKSDDANDGPAKKTRGRVSIQKHAGEGPQETQESVSDMNKGLNWLSSKTFKSPKGKTPGRASMTSASNSFSRIPLDLSDDDDSSNDDPISQPLTPRGSKKSKKSKKPKSKSSEAVEKDGSLARDKSKSPKSGRAKKASDDDLIRKTAALPLSEEVEKDSRKSKSPKPGRAKKSSDDNLVRKAAAPPLSEEVERDGRPPRGDKSASPKPGRKKKESDDDLVRTSAKPPPKQKSKVEMEYDNALAWLENNTNMDLEDAIYFKKLDNMLPKKPGQTMEQRAHEMQKALKWIKNKGVFDAKKPTPVPVPEEPPKTKSPPPPPKKEADDLVRKSTAPPPKQKSQAEKEIGNAVAWLENNTDMDLEDAVYFKKLDNMLPRKPGQSTEDRAREMQKALKWVKNKGVFDAGSKTKEEEPAVPSSPVPTKPVKEVEKSPKAPTKASKWDVARKNLVTAGDLAKQAKAREKAEQEAAKDTDADNALRWLQSGGASNLPDATTFKRLDSKIPKKPGQSLEERANEMAKALKFLRKKDDKMPATKKGDNGPSPERDFTNAIEFITTKQAGGDFMAVEDSAHFKKLDNMLPQKANQTPEERAKEMVKMLTWMRKKGKA